MAQIFCFGDSITYGSDDLISGGWANKLRIFMDNKNSASGLVYNLGIPGEMTDGLVNRFELETINRIRPNKYGDKIFIFAYGANDTIFFASKNGFVVNKDQFKENLGKVIHKAKDFEGKIYIQTITPVVDDKIINHPNKDKIRKNEYVDEYNKKILEIIKEQGINLIDVNKAFKEIDYNNLFVEDGLHPNDKGHELIFNEVIKEIL